MVFAKIQREVYETTVQDYELQLKQARAYFDIGKKLKLMLLMQNITLEKQNLI